MTQHRALSPSTRRVFNCWYHLSLIRQAWITSSQSPSEPGGGWVTLAGGECAASEGDDVAGGIEAARRQAGTAVAAACAAGAHELAAEAVQLFLPGCPLEGCLRFLQVCTPCSSCSQDLQRAAQTSSFWCKRLCSGEAGVLLVLLARRLPQQ